jgi:hypothetical protein
MGGIHRAGKGTLSYGLIGSSVLLIEAGARVDQDDFDELIRFADGATRKFDAILVIEPGSGIDARQRKSFASLLERTGVRVAVLTESTLARGAAIAIRWFNPSLDVFAPHQHSRALEFLGHPEIADLVADRLASV